MNENKKKNVIAMALMIGFFLFILVNATMAYLAARIDTGAESDIKLVTKTTDSLLFESGGDISFSVGMDDFVKGGNNASGKANVSATLKSNDTTGQTVYKYNVLIDITENGIVYTTLEPNQTPELILRVKNPNNEYITTMENLEYKTVTTSSGTVSGFDITEKTGKFTISSDYEITSIMSMPQVWEAEVIFINLDSDQQLNTEKTFSSTLMIQQEEVVDEVTAMVDEKMATMTLDEKIAQMVIMSFTGNTMSTDLQNSLAYKPGGVIFFAANIASTYTDTVNFINQIKATSDIMPFISIDQEGGNVQRLSPVTGDATRHTSFTDATVTKIPYMWNVGATNDVNKSYNVGKVMAEELLSVGFNLDFAPDLDVVADPTVGAIKYRSFGSDPTVVSNNALSLGKGIEDTGVIPVYKHFPGHGATSTDSHYSLPVLTQTVDDLKTRDLIPFQNAIDSGVDIIMVGHLAIPNIDSTNTPASLSDTLINGLLKNEMGFKGLVITDSLQMSAVADNYTEKAMYEKAINAGVDILLMPRSDVGNVVSLIKQSITEGTISEQRIEEAARKIITLKYKKLAKESLSKDYLGSTAHQTVIDGITIVKEYP